MLQCSSVVKPLKCSW